MVLAPTTQKQTRAGWGAGPRSRQQVKGGPASRHLGELPVGVRSRICRPGGLGAGNRTGERQNRTPFGNG